MEVGVESTSVVSRRRVGWNLWVWLVVVVVRRYIVFLILLITTPLVSVLFFVLFVNSVKSVFFLYKMMCKMMYHRVCRLY